MMKSQAPSGYNGYHNGYYKLLLEIRYLVVPEHPTRFWQHVLSDCRSRGLIAQHNCEISIVNDI